jgi:chromosome segregation ATPase
MKGPTLPSNEILEQHISNPDELPVTHVFDTMSKLNQGLMEMLKGKTKSLVGKSVNEYRRVKAGLLEDCGAMTDLSNEGVNGMDQLVREEVTKRLEVAFSKKIDFLEKSTSELGSELERLQDQLRETGSKLEDEENSKVRLHKEVVVLKETLERKDREILEMLRKQKRESDKSSDKIASLKVEIDRANAKASGLKAQENDPKDQANPEIKSLLTGSC